jgi:hypothetical protein
VVVFNKDARSVDITLTESSSGFKSATIERLEAPGIDSKLGITFDGAELGNDGQLHTRGGERLKAHGGRLAVHVPGNSSALIRLA